MNELAFFVAERDSHGETLIPQPSAAGNWGPSRMRGMAVSGALARATEQAMDQPSLRPVRWTLDLCRVASMEPCRVDVSIVRSGRRLCLIESALWQSQTVVAKASALFLRPEPRRPQGTVWTPPETPVPPPPDMVPDGGEPRLYYSDGVGWAAPSARHQNAGRKQVWMLPFEIVEGEQATAFQHAASAADVASVVINWGDAGIEYINADVTLALSRLPVGREVGLAALDRAERDGIATGTVSVFDRAGVLGTAVVCALANAGTTVDPRLR